MVPEGMEPTAPDEPIAEGLELEELAAPVSAAGAAGMSPAFLHPPSAKAAVTASTSTETDLSVKRDMAFPL